MTMGKMIEGEGGKTSSVVRERVDKREAVRVGEVLVRLRGENGKDDHCDAVGVGVDKDRIAITVSKDHVRSGNNGKQGPTQKLIRNYRSHVDDLE